MAEGVFDVAVIGGGPGGYVAAIRARQLGKTTILIEKDKLGGRCLNYACIPAKAVLRSADVLAEVQHASTYGVSVPDGVAVDFATVAKRRDRVVKTMTGGVGGLMKKNEVLVVEGEATFAPPGDEGVVDMHVMTADGLKLVRAANVVIATGSVALPVPVEGVAFGDRIVDTAGAWLAPELPQSLAVIGAGASGVEVASAFGRMGVPVTLLEALPQILPAEEPDIAAALAKELAKQNVNVVAGAQIQKVAQDANGVQIQIAGSEPLVVDRLVIAAGRAPDVGRLNIGAYGIAANERGVIQVGPDQRTSHRQIFAIGDVVPGPALAHKASEEAVVAVETISGWTGVHPIDVNNVPRVTFCSPQVASIGFTEAQAHAAGIQVRIGEFPLAAAGAATVYGDRSGLIKIIGDATTGQIVGAHAIGPKAGDIIAELGVAKSAGVGFAQLGRIIHAHPTISEAVMEAARATDGWALHV